MTGEQETESEVLVINEGEVKTLEEGVDENEDKIPRSVTPPCISIPDTMPPSDLQIQMSTFEYQGNILNVHILYHFILSTTETV